MRPLWFHSHDCGEDGEDTDYETESEEKAEKGKNDDKAGMKASKFDKVVENVQRDPDKGERGVGWCMVAIDTLRMGLNRFSTHYLHITVSHKFQQGRISLPPS